MLKHWGLVLSDGHRVGVSTGGEGVPLVFFHGFTANRKLYAPILTRLARYGFAVIAIDMAGHGDTEPLGRGHTFADMVDLAVATLRELGVHEAVMAGHSLGGRMVAELAARHPRRVHHAVLINAAVGADFDNLDLDLRSAARLPLGLAGAAFDLLGDVPWTRPVRAARYAHHLVGWTPGSASGIVNVAMATKGPKPPTLELLSTMRHRGVPTTVIHSVWDLIVPFRNGQQAARATGGDLVTLAGFHNWPMARPARAAREIAEVASAALPALPAVSIN